MSEKALIEEMADRCAAHARGRHLLVIQDTTSFNLGDHRRRIKPDTGLGPVENNNDSDIGFFMHLSLVVDDFSDTVLGFSHIKLWSRVYDDPQRATHIRKLPIEQKESNKWIEGSKDARDRLARAASITIIEDRDGDIYEQFATLADERTSYIIRICKQRKLSDGGRLLQTLHDQPLAATYQIKVGADKRKKKTARTATLELRFIQTEVMCPADHLQRSTLPSKVKISAVEVLETGYTGKDSICWRLLTTRELTSVEQALEVVECYRKRWRIEQLFRLLKKQGFGLEETELESGWAVRKLVLLALNATLRLMQLLYADDVEGAQPLEEVFSDQEIECMDQLQGQVQGRTEKLSNPYRPKTLLWARWIIARLGGWKGYRSQRSPGPITLKKGLDAFTHIFQGWTLAAQYFRDVGTQ